MAEQELLAAISNIIQVQIEPVKEELKEIRTSLENVETRLENVETRLENVETRLDKVEAGLRKVETRLDKVEARLDNVEARLEKVEIRLDKVEARLDKLETRMDKVEENAAETRFLLENDISRKINVIGEGHDFLKQRLENALTMEMKREAMELQLIDMQIEMKSMKRLIGEHDEMLRKIS